MTSRSALTLSISALVAGGTLVGCAAQPGGLASASEASSGRAVDLAAQAAANAKSAMLKHKGAAAVVAAEAAVGWAPQDAGYRALLGQSYISAGRFLSARDAYADALTLAPRNPQIALNLALAQTASGDWDSARKTLDAHADIIPAADRGLALALAGDPGSAVQILTEAARAPGADAKTRQNLALSLALAGRWPEAKAVASLDLGPDQVDHRIEEWAAFAYPKSQAQQVASLLGVSPVEDHGQPVALALVGHMPNSIAAESVVQTAAAETQVAVTPTVEVVASTGAESRRDTAPAELTVVAATPVADARPAIAFAKPQEVAQTDPIKPVKFSKPAANVAPVAKMAVVRKTSAPMITKGNFYVQLGAYQNAAVARDGWARATRRFAAFANHQPQGMPITANGVNYYRLSVGGFAKSNAAALCQAYRVHGGACFVRPGQGDQIARWVQGAPQLAMR